jgi:hypothetical protein
MTTRNTPNDRHRSLTETPYGGGRCPIHFPSLRLAKPITPRGISVSVKLEDLEGLQLEVDVAGRLRLAAIAIPTVKGMVMGKLWQQQEEALGRKMDFTVLPCGTVKPRPGSRRPRHAREKKRKKKRKKKERKGSCFLARAGLSSYLCRLCPMCVNPSMLGVVSTPPQYFTLLRCLWAVCSCRRKGMMVSYVNESDSDESDGRKFTI